MPALQLYSHFVPKIHPIYTTPFSSRQNLSTALPRIFSPRMSATASSPRHSTLGSVAPLEAILFDIDGTLVDSDPYHYYAFKDMLQEVGFNGGEPITEEFFVKSISGKHNDELCNVLFPDWDLQKARKFFVDKEAMFRRLAAKEMKAVSGLEKVCQWVDDRGLKRAAVTNAPRENVDQIISLLGL